jgi:hypothetical protein
MKTLDSKKKARFEGVEPGLFRYQPSGSYYTVLKKDGKTKWRDLQTNDKASARGMLADEREADAELDSRSLLKKALLKKICHPDPSASLGLKASRRISRRKMIATLVEADPSTSSG